MDTTTYEDSFVSAWSRAKFPDENRAFVKSFCDEIGMSVPELSIRWVISNPDISTVLMGAANKQQVEDNFASVERGPLPADIRKRADAIAAMVPFRPFEEPGLRFEGVKPRKTAPTGVRRDGGVK